MGDDKESELLGSHANHTEMTKDFETEANLRDLGLSLDQRNTNDSISTVGMLDDGFILSTN